MIPVDLENKSVSELRTLANRLRTEYKMFKDEHPLQQSEEIINQFLLIRDELKKRKKSLSAKDSALDKDARALSSVAKIMPIPFIPKTIEFDDSKKIQIFSDPEKFAQSLKQPHICMYCDDPALTALIIEEGKSFIPVCWRHKTNAYLDLS